MFPGSHPGNMHLASGKILSAKLETVVSRLKVRSIQIGPTQSDAQAESVGCVSLAFLIEMPILAMHRSEPETATMLVRRTDQLVVSLYEIPRPDDVIVRIITSHLT